MNSDVNSLIDVWLIKHHPGFLVVWFLVFLSSHHSGVTASVGSIEPATADVALPGYQVSYVALCKRREHIFLIEMAKLWLLLPLESRKCRCHCSSPLPNVSESLSPARLPLIPICVGRGSGEAELSITPDESCRHNNNNNSNAAVRNSHSLRPLRSLSSVLSQRTLLSERRRGLNYPRHKSSMKVMQVWLSDLWLCVYASH